MGTELDLDDVAATSEQAKNELDELREQVGEPTNPRYLLWRVWHGDNQNMKNHDFMAWNSKRLSEFCTENNRHRRFRSEQDGADYEVWLLQWVRNDIAMKVSRAEAF